VCAELSIDLNYITACLWWA